MKILGINFGHSAAAVLFVDGKVVAAIEEEKLSRIKGEATFPHRAIAFVLEKGGLSVADLDRVAVGCERIMEFAYGYRNLNKYFGRTSPLDKFRGLFYDGLKRILSGFNTAGALERSFYSSLKAMGFPRSKIHLVNHHEAHAASAYYASPWKEAIIFTSDGKGDGLCGSCYVGKEGTLRCVDTIEDLNSLGQFYQSVTKFLGYRVNRHEGKITGLAAFGDPQKTFALMNQIFRFDDGNFHNAFHDNVEFRGKPLSYFKEKVDRKGFIHRNYIAALNGTLINYAAAYQMYLNFMEDNMKSFQPKDMAAGIQKLAEDATVAYMKKRLKQDPQPNVCLAGGVFANVKINQRVREIPGIKNIFVQPAMDDAGTALGAALLVWMKESKKNQWQPPATAYLGPSFTDQQIEASLKKYGLKYRRVDNYEEVLGKLIYDGKVVGRFNGALEWGPRALGNRSIIARPIEKDINDILNERLRRTEFMPFAPSMLAEDAPEFLESYAPDHIAARYMTITYDVKKDKIDQIQAAVHVDGTARPQVVFKEDNPSFYNIIKAYKKHSGFGVVINTSFNMHEEPIVSSPDDAIRSFLIGAIDVLSLGAYIVEERPMDTAGKMDMNYLKEENTQGVAI